MTAPLRTLQIIGSKRLGGAERWFLRFNHALRERGVETHAVVRRGSELDDATLINGEMSALPLRSVWDPLSKWELSQSIRRLQPDLVQSYMGRATRLTRLGRAGRHRPVHLARLGGYYKLDGYRHADAWIGNTRGLCDYLISNGFPARRVFHIYNFLDLPKAVSDERLTELRERFAIPLDAWVIMTPGRFVPVKGQRYLLEAFAALPRTLHDRPLQLVMVGDGVLAEPLKAQARSLAIDDRMTWAGWQREPGPWLQMADIIAFPSLHGETFGNVVLEAWAHAKPLVTSAFPGALEYAHDGEDCLRVPCADAAALATAIRRLIDEPALAMAIAKAGHQRVRNDFGREAIMAQYLALYHELANSRR